MQDDDLLIDLKRIWSILKRQKELIAAFVLGFLILAGGYVALATPRYTAHAMILLDRKITAAISDISALNQTSFETAALESEVEVIRSRRVTDEALHILLEKEYFKDKTQEHERDDIVNWLLRGLKVNRIRQTYVLSVGFTSNDPVLSADIANAYAESYIRNQMEAVSEMSTHTSDWLQLKINEMSEKAAEARQIASDFRVKINELQRNDPQSGETENALGVLRNLEKEAQTYNALHDSYVERLGSLTSRQNFPVSETRIITRASPPDYKSHPRTRIVLAAALIFGLGIGFLVALLRESLDHSLRRGGQVIKELGKPFIGFLPERHKSLKKIMKFTHGTGPQTLDVAFESSSVEEPFSLFSETVRAIRNAADSGIPDKSKRVIGIVSADPNEGKFIVAANLAYFLSQSTSCVLIDADIRASTPGLSLRPAERVGSLADVLLRNMPLSRAMLRHVGNKLALLPSFPEDSGETLAHLNAGSAKALVEECLREFEYVVINLPPLLTPADFYSFAQTVDRFLIVAEWGKTLSNSLNFHILQNAVPAEQILGVVLENADMRRLEKHYGHKRPS